VTRVVCIGECMVELRAAGPNTFARSFAGDAYNTAVYLKRSLPGARVQFLTAVGNDSMSLAMRAAWASEDVDGDLAFTVGGGSPGIYLIESDASGERRFRYWRSTSAARRWFVLLRDQGEVLLEGADLVFFSGISLAILEAGERADAIELFARLRGHVGRIAFDPNIRLALWGSVTVARPVIEAAVSIADVVLPSSDDARLLFDTEEPLEQLGRFQQAGGREVALTMGPAGCLIADGDVRLRVDAPSVAEVVDTSGAGDAFDGTYLARRLGGSSPAESAETALLVSSRVVGHPGAVVPAAISHPDRRAATG
jgi:2-dehydro-3-deoxygluconokinase